jgi:hypothetical protein
MKVDIVVIPASGTEPAQLRVVMSLGDPAALVAMPGRALDKQMSEAVRVAESRLTAWLDSERTRAKGGGTRPSSTLPTLSTSPSCKGCGTAVSVAGELCPSCEHKVHLRQAPQPSVALVNQGEPLYRREGNFRDAPTEREDATT